MLHGIEQVVIIREPGQPGTPGEVPVGRLLHPQLLMGQRSISPRAIPEIENEGFSIPEKPPSQQRGRKTSRASPGR